MFKNKLAALAVMSSAFIATNSYAGAVADAVTTATKQGDSCLLRIYRCLLLAAGQRIA